MISEKMLEYLMLDRVLKNIEGVMALSEERDRMLIRKELLEDEFINEYSPTKYKSNNP